MEYQDTDLDKVLKHKIDFGPKHVIKVLYYTLLSMSFMHNINIIHRDIKPANILVTKQCKIKICDFGLSRSLPKLDRLNTLELRHHISQRFDYHTDRTLQENEQHKNAILTSLLLEDRPKRDVMKRHVSLHVGSRWYRAPEISIIEKQYDQASDLWGIGCILYELLFFTLINDQSQKYIKSEFQNKRFLFQGDSCFPLSPTNKEDGSSAKSHLVSKKDQVKVIIKTIGPQSDKHLSFISNANAITYVKDMQNSIAKEPEYIKYEHAHKIGNIIKKIDSELDQVGLIL